MKKTYLLGIATSLLLGFSACRPENRDFSYYYYTPEHSALLSEQLDLPNVPYDYEQASLINSNIFVQIVNRDMATLGRVLFYDKKLSRDGKVACANCHKQELAFGDDKAVSLGVFDRPGDRNSIALLSVASFASQYGTDLNGSQGKRFFWDNRAETASAQSRGSMTNPKEMDMTMEEVADIVAATDYYEPLFLKAFGDASVNSDRVTEAIAGFVNAMGSTNSRFDKALAEVRKQGNGDFSVNFPLLSASENRGKAIYINKCGDCHGADVTTIHLNFASNGLDQYPKDLGVGDVSQNVQEMGTFKVPSLRNVALSAPYMHDGRFQNLEQVIDFYSTGVQNHVNLHTVLRNLNGTPKKFNFSHVEKQDLIAFMNTLTDKEALMDKRFANPYK